MLNDVLKGKWRQIRGQIKEAWGALTDDDLDRISGEWDHLVGKLQERYGYTKEKAEAEIAEFLDDLNETPDERLEDDRVARS